MDCIFDRVMVYACMGGVVLDQPGPAVCLSIQVPQAPDLWRRAAGHAHHLLYCQGEVHGSSQHRSI